MHLYEVMGDTIASMLEAVDPVAQGCYASIFDFYDIAIDYYDTISDPRKLAYNMVHNLGQIYDDTNAIIMMFRYPDYESRSFWKKVGYYSGDIVHQIGY